VNGGIERNDLLPVDEQRGVGRLRTQRRHGHDGAYGGDKRVAAEGIHSGL
jgi:hypothetical protein